MEQVIDDCPLCGRVVLEVMTWDSPMTMGLAGPCGHVVRVTEEQDRTRLSR